MSEYTPTTDVVRAAYAPPSDQPRKAERDAEFDRWLAAHDAEVRKSARREFVQEIRDLGAEFEAAVLREVTPMTAPQGQDEYTPTTVEEAVREEPSRTDIDLRDLAPRDNPEPWPWGDSNLYRQGAP